MVAAQRSATQAPGIERAACDDAILAEAAAGVLFSCFFLDMVRLDVAFCSVLGLFNAACRPVGTDGGDSRRQRRAPAGFKAL